MKTKTSCRRSALLFGLATTLAMPIVNAQTSFTFEPFRSEDIANSSYSFIQVSGTLMETHDGVRITISNESQPGDGWVTETRPTIARIYFAGSSYAPYAPTFNSGASFTDVAFSLDGSPGNLPGGNTIGFNADFSFSANPPPPKKGLDPGESAAFTFAGADYAQMASGIENGSFRIGVHIIEVGNKGQDSVPFVAVPEPSSVLLGGLGLLALLRRKRK
jgi:hypothetical protein